MFCVKAPSAGAARGSDNPRSWPERDFSVALMFPLEFPIRVLSREFGTNAKVLDPFCGRGTTNVAARSQGMSSVGIDSHPLAIALTKAKLVSTNPNAIVRALDRILSESDDVDEVPTGEFWELAFEETTLTCISKIRSALKRDCRSSARVALRAILLGALHGPVMKRVPSYLSNQCPRTYAPKPRYAITYWLKHNLRPQKVSVRDLVARRAYRYYANALPRVPSRVLLGDSREEDVFQKLDGQLFDWIVTSPPYYGLRTYRPDQWLRLWFLGGSDFVDYSQHGQLTHESPESFVEQLAVVWRNCSSVCRIGARMVVRFGQISDRQTNSLEILRQSFSGTNWRIQTRCDAGSASVGKRQADQFGVDSTAQREFDLWVIND